MVRARMRWAMRSGEPGRCFGEVVFEPHLAFQVREDALDHEPGGGEGAFAAEVGGGAGLVGGEQADAVGGEPFAVAAAPEALVGDHDLGRGAGKEVGEWLVLLLVGGHDRVAERQPALVGQQDEPHAPDEAVLRLGVAVAGKAGEVGFAAGSRGSWRPRAGCRRRGGRRPRRASGRAAAARSRSARPDRAAGGCTATGRADAETSPAAPGRPGRGTAGRS